MRVNVTLQRTPRLAHQAPLAGALMALAMAALGPAAGAQAGLTGVASAEPVPWGMVRFSATPSWLRYTSRFTAGGGTEPLGAVLTSDALGTAQIPALRRFESALQALTGDSDVRLSLGGSVATAGIRVVTTPLALDFGVTDRLSLGVVLPIVQRQRELVLDIEPRGPLSTGNVGPVGNAALPAMYARAGALATGIDAAATQLAARIATCTGQPATAGCSAISADRAGADATVLAARQVAEGLRYVYGTAASAPGIGLVPHRSLTATIDARLAELNTRFATYLGAAPLSDTSAPAGSNGLATAESLRSLSRRGFAGIGQDSLSRITKLGVGDLELGARYVVWDNSVRGGMTDSVPGALRVRALAGVLARLATGAPGNDDELFLPGAGDGQSDVEGSLAVDVEAAGRLGVTLAGRYTAQLGSIAATRLPDDGGSMTPFGARGSGSRSLGDILALEVSPRYRLGNAFHVTAHYAFLRRGDDSFTFDASPLQDSALHLDEVDPLPASASAGGFTEQRAGIGMTYSTFAAWERGGVRLPIEVSYSHLETFSGSSAMVPRAGRDQIQVRLYYRVRR